MEKILSLHTSLPRALVTLSQGSDLIASQANEDMRKHAAFLHEALQQLLSEVGWALGDLSAISVTAGPGSYTGIRVGLSAAKGMCFALKIPLIVLNTLEAIALTAILEMNHQPAAYIAALHARRDELFVAGYQANLEAILAPTLIHPADFRLETDKELILTGNGARELIENTSIQWHTCQPENTISARALAAISWQKFDSKYFTNVNEADAFYLKEAYVKVPGP